MKTKKRIIGIFLAACLALTLMPAWVFAGETDIDAADEITLADENIISADTSGENAGSVEEPAEDPDYEEPDPETGEPAGALLIAEDEDYEDERGWGDAVYILGKRITSENCDDVLGDGGSVVYDHETRTLTLKEAVLDLANYESDAQENNTVYAIETYRPLNIVVLKGMSLICSSAESFTDDKEYVYGISATGELTISGPGTLQIILDTEVNTPSGNIQKYYGIDSWGKLTVDQAELWVAMLDGGTAVDTGISAGWRGFELRNGADVEVIGKGSNNTAVRDTSFNGSVIEAGSTLKMSSENRAFSYTALPVGIMEMGAMVSASADSEGAAAWDKTTPLNTYKYISIPEQGRGFGEKVYILGKEITEANKNDVLGDGGSVKYDFTTKTLTLTGADLDLADYVDPGEDNNYTAGINAFGDLNIVAEGYSTIHSEIKDYPAGKEYVFGITADGDLEIGGTGTLTIDITAEDKDIEIYYGIDSETLDVDCRSLEVLTNGTGTSYGIWSWSGITVESGAKVFVDTQGEKSVALYDLSNGKTVVKTAAELDLRSDNCAFRYNKLDPSLSEQGALVNGKPTPEGAFKWDGTTRLSVYKYVKFPYDNTERGWGDSIYVLGRRVTEENCSDVLNDGGSVAYDHESRTLTLTGAQLDLAEFQSEATEYNTAYGISAWRELTIVLKGDNKIISRAESFPAEVEYVYGIDAEGELDISGTGTLGIELYTGLTAPANVQAFYGIDSAQLLTVGCPVLTVATTGTGTAKVTGIDANWNGISVKKDSAVSVSVEGEKCVAFYDSSFGKSELEDGAVIEMTGEEHAFGYTILSKSIEDNVVLVNEEASAAGAAPWDGTTRLDTYKYVKAEVPVELTDDNVKLSSNSFTYNTKVQKPTVTVEYNGKKLTEGTDYSLSYSDDNSKNVGTYKVSVMGVRNRYIIDVTKEYKIVKASSTISIPDKETTYSGKAVNYKVKEANVKGSSGAVSFKYYSDKACKKEIPASRVKNAGTYYAKASVAADDNYKAATSSAAQITVKKATQKVKEVKPLTKKLAKGNSFTLKATATKEQGTAVFTQTSGKSYVKVTSTGKVTLKSKAQKGKTYKVKVKVKIKATTNYQATKQVKKTVKITVK